MCTGVFCCCQMSEKARMKYTLRLEEEGREVCDGLYFRWEFIPVPWTDPQESPVSYIGELIFMAESFIVLEEWSC